MPHPTIEESAPRATLRPRCEQLPLRRRHRRVPKPIIIVPKIRYRRTERGERMLTVAAFSQGDELQPMIRIRGRWLAKLGFTRDARIVVTEEHGRLVLTLASEE